MIDTDGNGHLSYDEVYELSIASLQRSIETNGPGEVIKEIAQYFADLIFKLVDIPKNMEIPLPKIKEKILLGGTEGHYLEMFCCTDTISREIDVKFT